MSLRTQAGRVSAVIFLLWLMLAGRVGVAIVRHESFSGDLALPVFALFVLSTLLVNRVWFHFRPVKDEVSSRTS